MQFELIIFTGGVVSMYVQYHQNSLTPLPVLYSRLLNKIITRSHLKLITENDELLADAELLFNVSRSGTKYSHEMSFFGPRRPSKQSPLQSLLVSGFTSACLSQLNCYYETAEEDMLDKLQVIKDLNRKF